jgi:hypothetical protein
LDFEQKTKMDKWQQLTNRLVDFSCLSFYDFNLLVSASTQQVPGCGVLRDRGGLPLNDWLNELREKRPEQLRLVGRVLAANKDQTAFPMQIIREFGFAKEFGLN